jgi:hypothetical protein
MNFHILELKKRNKPGKTFENEQTRYDLLEPVPSVHPGFSKSSVVFLRPWTHIALNEGSFLKAYGTYEYFERGPPSLVYSINQCFMPRGKLIEGRYGACELPALRSFTYTGIFPFSDHVIFSHLLKHLEELDVRFAPDVESGILDDKERVGRAQLQDCWQELTAAHAFLAQSLATRSEPTFNLKKFVCGDSRIVGLQEELEELYIPLCLPTWGETATPGVFRRVTNSGEWVDYDSGSDC